VLILSIMVIRFGSKENLFKVKNTIYPISLQQYYKVWRL